MNLFKRRVEPDAEGFYPTKISADSVLPNQMQPVKINGEKVVLARYEDKIHVFTSVCPHAAADMSKGELSRWKVYCPDHEYCFDIRNGRINWPEDEVYRLKKYPIKLVDGEIYLKI